LGIQVYKCSELEREVPVAAGIAGALVLGSGAFFIATESKRS